MIEMRKRLSEIRSRAGCQNRRLVDVQVNGAKAEARHHHWVVPAALSRRVDALVAQVDSRGLRTQLQTMEAARDFNAFAALTSAIAPHLFYLTSFDPWIQLMRQRGSTHRRHIGAHQDAGPKRRTPSRSACLHTHLCGRSASSWSSGRCAGGGNPSSPRQPAAHNPASHIRPTSSSTSDPSSQPERDDTMRHLILSRVQLTSTVI
jgi:hypothetical protein